MLRSITYAMLLIIAAISLVPRPQQTNTPFDKLSQSVVTVRSDNGGGTGFLTTASSGTPYVITNAHVCGERKSMLVQRTGDEVAYLVPVIRSDRSRDLCALTQVPGVKLELGEEPLRWAELYVLGHPLLRPQRAVRGFYSGEEDIQIAEPRPDAGCAPEDKEVATFFGTYCLHRMITGQTTIPTYPGNSGSPITDANGLLQGVINCGDNMNNGCFVPLRELKAFLSTL